MAAKKTTKKTAKKASKAKKGSDAGMSKAEQVGYHKGSLTTLIKERQELARLLSIVEQLVQMHMGALKELGVDLTAQAEQMGVAAPKKSAGGRKKPIDEIL